MKGITSIKNIDGVKSFDISKKDDVHKDIISFLIDIGFDESETIETFDIPFANFQGDLLYINNENGDDAYVIGFEETVKIIIKTETQPQDVYMIARQYF